MSTPDHQFTHRMEEIEIWTNGVYLGMWDASAVVDVSWDEITDDWVWDVADWMIHDERGGELSLNRLCSDPLMLAVKRILDAQFPLISDDIDAAVAEQMPAKPRHNEHRLTQRDFV